jgi:hypothetical protein
MTTTPKTRRGLRMVLAAAMTGIMAMAGGCAKRTESSRPAAADAPAAAASPQTPSVAPAPTSAPASASESTSTSWLSVDDQVREAVFRHLFVHNESGMKDSAQVYFLAIDEGGGKRRDPSPALMARFARQKPRVEPVSRADISFEKGAVHRETGERGLVFRVAAIKRVSDDVVEVEGGYYEGNLSASGTLFRVERNAGVWIVTSEKMQWIA